MTYGVKLTCRSQRIMRDNAKNAATAENKTAMHMSLIGTDDFFLLTSNVSIQPAASIVGMDINIDRRAASIRL